MSFSAEVTQITVTVPCSICNAGVDAAIYFHGRDGSESFEMLEHHILRVNVHFVTKLLVQFIECCMWHMTLDVETVSMEIISILLCQQATTYIISII
jgi:hypothetical protein